MSLGNISHFSTANFDERTPIANSEVANVGGAGLLMAICWVCIALRMYTRLHVQDRTSWDDLFFILYGVSATIGSVALSNSIKYGLGQHIMILPVDHIIRFLMNLYVINGTYMISTALIKIAVLLQCLRGVCCSSSSFRKHRRRALRIVIFALIVLAVLYSAGYAVLAWMPCRPINAFWYQTTIDKSAGVVCYGFGDGLSQHFKTVTYVSHAGVDLFLHLAVIGVAAAAFYDRVAWMLMDRHPRRLMMVLGFIGVITIVMGVWRMASLGIHKAGMFPVPDPTWYLPTPMLLGIAQGYLMSIAACLPVFWPDLPRYWNWFQQHSFTSSSSSKSAAAKEKKTDAIIIIPTSSPPHSSDKVSISGESSEGSSRTSLDTGLKILRDDKLGKPDVAVVVAVAVAEMHLEEAKREKEKSYFTIEEVSSSSDEDVTPH